MSYSPNYFQFSADNYTVNEGDLYPHIQINRSSGSDAAWLVFSTSDGTAQGGANLGPLDYQNVPGEFVYFEPSQTSAYVYLPNIYDDSHSESNETVNLHLRYVDSSFDLDTAILTIIDNDPAAISPIEFQDVDRDITVSEDVGQATITLTRTYNVGTATVNYATSSVGATATAGSDYTATSGTATFQNGSYTTTFSVSITQDSAPEAQEFFYLVLSKGFRTHGTRRPSPPTPFALLKSSSRRPDVAMPAASPLSAARRDIATPALLRWSPTKSKKPSR